MLLVLLIRYVLKTRYIKFILKLTLGANDTLGELDGDEVGGFATHSLLISQ